MSRRDVPEIPSGSMADIAFMLLIFFLVATTMSTDSGIMRKLPPIAEQDQQDDIEIKERNVFVVLINSNNQLLVENQILNIKQLKEKAKEFIANKANLETLPEKKQVDIDLLGPTMVSKQVISLQNDRGTKYEMYIAVQNELTKAYNELRDEFSMGKWSKKYDNLSTEQQEAVRNLYPMRISESEPKNIGGK
jgi:biopolymer transport protein ExbD